MSQAEDRWGLQFFLNDTAQYYFTIIYALALLFQIASLYKTCVLNKRKPDFFRMPILV